MFLTPTLIILSTLCIIHAKIYERCELARELRNFDLPEDEIPTWVCIAQHESNYNTSAMNPGSGDHGLFQISQIYWCSPPGNGYGCNSPCSKFRDDDIADDLQCIRRIYNEHTRISGDGFNAWVVYPLYCKNDNSNYVLGCFDQEPFEKPDVFVNSTENEIPLEEVDEYGDGYQFPSLPSVTRTELQNSKTLNLGGDRFEFLKLPFSRISIHDSVPTETDVKSNYPDFPFSKQSIHEFTLVNRSSDKMIISVNPEAEHDISEYKPVYSKSSIHDFVPPPATSEEHLIIVSEKNDQFKANFLPLSKISEKNYGHESTASSEKPVKNTAEASKEDVYKLPTSSVSSKHPGHDSVPTIKDVKSNYPNFPFSKQSINDFILVNRPADKIILSTNPEVKHDISEHKPVYSKYYTHDIVSAPATSKERLIIVSQKNYHDKANFLPLAEISEKNYELSVHKPIAATESSKRPIENTAEASKEDVYKLPISAVSSKHPGHDSVLAIKDLKSNYPNFPYSKQSIHDFTLVNRPSTNPEVKYDISEHKPVYSKYSTHGIIFAPTTSKEHLIIVSQKNDHVNANFLPLPEISEKNYEHVHKSIITTESSAKRIKNTAEASKKDIHKFPILSVSAKDHGHHFVSTEKPAIKVDKETDKKESEYNFPSLPTFLEKIEQPKRVKNNKAVTIREHIKKPIDTSSLIPQISTTESLLKQDKKQSLMTITKKQFTENVITISSLGPFSELNYSTTRKPFQLTKKLHTPILTKSESNNMTLEHSSTNVGGTIIPQLSNTKSLLKQDKESLITTTQNPFIKNVITSSIEPALHYSTTRKPFIINKKVYYTPTLLSFITNSLSNNMALEYNSTKISSTLVPQISTRESLLKQDKQSLITATQKPFTKLAITSSLLHYSTTRNPFNLTKKVYTPTLQSFITNSVSNHMTLKHSDIIVSSTLIPQISTIESLLKPDKQSLITTTRKPFTRNLVTSSFEPFFVSTTKKPFIFTKRVYTPTLQSFITKSVSNNMTLEQVSTKSVTGNNLNPLMYTSKLSSTTSNKPLQRFLNPFTTSLSLTNPPPGELRKTIEDEQLEDNDLQVASSTFIPFTAFKPVTTTPKPFLTSKPYTITTSKMFSTKPSSATLGQLSTTRKPTSVFKLYTGTTSKPFTAQKTSLILGVQRNNVTPQHSSNFNNKSFTTTVPKQLYTTTSRPKSKQVTFAPDSFLSWIFGSQTLPPIVPPARPPRPQRPSGERPGGPPLPPPPPRPSGDRPTEIPSLSLNQRPRPERPGGLPRPPRPERPSRVRPGLVPRPPTTRKPLGEIPANSLRPFSYQQGLTSLTGKSLFGHKTVPPTGIYKSPFATSTPKVLVSKEVIPPENKTPLLDKGKQYPNNVYRNNSGTLRTLPGIFGRSGNEANVDESAVEVKLDDNFVFLRTRYGYRLFRNV